MTAMRRRAAGVVVAAFSLGLAGCAPPLDDPTRGWDEPASYTATVDYRAYDTEAGTYRIVVVNHVPTEFERIDSRGAVFDTTGLRAASDFTLRQIVGRYQTALADRESAETLTWDAAKMPSEVDIDWYPLQITDEQAWTITDIEVQAP